MSAGNRPRARIGGFDTLNWTVCKRPSMKRLIIHGDPGIRKDAIISYDGGEEVRCFSISRNGEWHGPDEVQLWCIVGDESERQDFDEQNYIPHHLEVDRVDAETVDVIKAKGKLSV